MQAANISYGSLREIAWLQGLTMTWMLVECSVALWSAYQARSVALLAFGADSFVELLSAAVVVLQFVPVIQLAEGLAARLASVLLFVLAAVVTGICLYSLARGLETEMSAGGIAITGAALLIMPVLGALKRQKAGELSNRALAADAVQSATCGYLALVTLLSLLANAVFHIRWLDPVAGLLAIPVLLMEGRRAWQGGHCSCCH
jgi:divalent metal cation (Fe/Co/Zn/Cd) transporter